MVTRVAEGVKGILSILPANFEFQRVHNGTLKFYGLVIRCKNATLAQVQVATDVASVFKKSLHTKFQLHRPQIEFSLKNSLSQ
jgi:hypothetical protein